MYRSQQEKKDSLDALIYVLKKANALMILIAITAILNGFFCKLQSPLVSKMIIILTATPNHGFQKAKMATADAQSFKNKTQTR